MHDLFSNNNIFQLCEYLKIQMSKLFQNSRTFVKFTNARTNFKCVNNFQLSKHFSDARIIFSCVIFFSKSLTLLKISLKYFQMCKYISNSWTPVNFFQIRENFQLCKCSPNTLRFFKCINFYQICELFSNWWTSIKVFQMP